MVDISVRTSVVAEFDDTPKEHELFAILDACIGEMNGPQTRSWLRSGQYSESLRQAANEVWK